MESFKIMNNECRPSVSDVADFIARRGKFLSPVPGYCAFCGKQLESSEEAMVFPRMVCDHIVKDEQLYLAAKAKVSGNELVDLWHKTVGRLFIDLLDVAEPDNRHQAKRIDWRKYDEALSWSPILNGKQSLMLVGESGAGKTTAALHRLKQYAENGRRFDIIGPSSLSNRLSGRSGFDRRSELVFRLKHISVVLVDDFAKEAMTETVSAILFDIIDARLSNKRTTIITSRYTGDTLSSRFLDQTKALDLTRRINDYCRVISFQDQSML